MNNIKLFAVSITMIIILVAIFAVVYKHCFASDSTSKDMERNAYNGSIMGITDAKEMGGKANNSLTTGISQPEKAGNIDDTNQNSNNETEDASTRALANENYDENPNTFASNNTNDVIKFQWGKNMLENADNYSILGLEKVFRGIFDKITNELCRDLSELRMENVNNGKMMKLDDLKGQLNSGIVVDQGKFLEDMAKFQNIIHGIGDYKKKDFSVKLNQIDYYLDFYIIREIQNVSEIYFCPYGAYVSTNFKIYIAVLCVKEDVVVGAVIIEKNEVKKK